MKPLLKFVSAALFALIAFPICFSQTSTAQGDDEKAEKIVQKAIAAVGGDSYLKLQTVIGRGFFTEYAGGSPGLPLRFVDYIVYPNRERTEFNGGGNRVIQTNDQEQGWLLDMAAKTIKDQTPQQVADFKSGLRTSMENLLRGWWRKEGATLSYAGRREAGLAKRNETVRLTYPDGFWIEFEFGAADGMPAKILYKKPHKNLETDQMEDVPEEDRLFRLLTISGVVAPFVIDHFRNGVQTSRINYESIEFNKPIADSIFAKPANIKGVK